jgi:arginine decarboxylase
MINYCYFFCFAGAKIGLWWRLCIYCQGPGMNIRQIQEARDLYGIEDWGAGYFGIDDEGVVVCHPTGEEHRSVQLPKVLEYCRERGLVTPIILRFPQVVSTQLTRMHHAFAQAISEFRFKGNHLGVFPFKVNQRREFIDSVVSCGNPLNYGLEVGSKSELLAAIGYPLMPDALLIVNGFKDEEFIEMAFIAKEMGKNLVVVVEGPDELQIILDLAKKRGELDLCPSIGLRIKLYSKGAGKWEKSSGETSKFGLSTREVLHCLEMLQESDLSHKLSMLHFHIGSQITEIKRFKNAIKEASRVYAKIRKLGFDTEYLNIGGGVGVDYDGSKTSYQSSANYSLQEFANDAVYVLGEVCNNEGIPHPTIVTESGRVIAAYHSVVVTDIREVQGEVSVVRIDDLNFPEADCHKGITELKYVFENINRKNFVEYFHDAIEYQEELFTLFNLGYLNLEDRALAEELFRLICRKATYFSSFEKHPSEEFENLQRQMGTKYLANFSIFQSIPDAWSIDQLFPVMPLSRHAEKPAQKACIVDITCDSDGCLDRFIDRREIKNTLDLHSPNGEPYNIGFFLVGAYQESLASEHNLFGAIHEAEVRIAGSGNFEITKLTQGDTIDELLICRNYQMSELVGSYQHQLEQSASLGVISKERAQQSGEKLSRSLKAYPYLTKNAGPYQTAF